MLPTSSPATSVTERRLASTPDGTSETPPGGSAGFSGLEAKTEPGPGGCGTTPREACSQGRARTVHVVFHHGGELQLRPATGSELQHPQHRRDPMGGDDDVVTGPGLDHLIENLDP